MRTREELETFFAEKAKDGQEAYTQFVIHYFGESTATNPASIMGLILGTVEGIFALLGILKENHLEKTILFFEPVVDEMVQWLDQAKKESMDARKKL